VLALAGAIVGTQFHSDPAGYAGAVPGSVTSYDVSAAAAGQPGPKASADAAGAGGLSQSARAAAVKKQGLTAGGRKGARSRAATTKPAATRHASKAKASVAACSGTGTADSAFLPANYVTIVDYLTRHGYADLAAAGMAGNMYQESKGNPESVGTGGGGLIGWTPLPSGYVTGDPAADLQTQLAAVLVYNQQWSQYIPALNAASTAIAAAYTYMEYFERPGIPATSNRESAAAAVAEACGFG
jgi:predicted ribonuclease toxin of YeeF-YezG toxin-antitoxin module